MKPVRLDLLVLKGLKVTLVLRVCKALKGTQALRVLKEKRETLAQLAQLALRARRGTPETSDLRVLREILETPGLGVLREILALRVKRALLALTDKVLTLPHRLADTRTPRPISTQIWRPLRACPPRWRLFKGVDV